MQQMTRSEFLAGAKTINTTAERLTVLGLKAYSYVLVCAGADNGDTVYVGHDSAVTSSTGYPLEAGEQVEVPIDDAGKIWVIGGDTGQVVKYLIA